MPSIAENGKFVRVLIVFVQFKDDNYQPDFVDWPKDQPPTEWMGAAIIDNSISQNSTNGNLTHYYSVMSMGQYKVIGNCEWIITPRTRDEYINLGWNRGQINKEILSELDNTFNFFDYDNWNKKAASNHEWGIDHEVDMIWMVYRNISKDKSNPGETAYNLGFASRYWDNYEHQYIYKIYSGEASLGGGGILDVDGGARKIDLNGFGLVSGLSVHEGFYGLGRIKSLIIHEYGHHLLGGMNQHCKTGTWGMMWVYGCKSSMVNSWERHRLGWINVRQYDYNPLIPLDLDDFIEDGDAIRIKIPGTTKYYYLENHNRLSILDNIDFTTDGKGIYVLFQSGNDNDDISFF